MRVPLHRRVQAQLVDRIATMAVGEMLPSEPELEREFGVSRATVRRAVETLVADGLVEKRQGRGTQVRERPAIQTVGQVYSWTDEMRRRGVPTSSTNLSIRREHPGRKLAEELNIRRTDLVVTLSRVRLVNDVPVAIMVNYLVDRLVPGLVERGLSSDSLYGDLTDTYGLDLIAGDETIRARSASALEAALLDVEDEAAVLHVRRRTLGRGNVPIEVVDMVARGDKYQYHAHLTGGRAHHAPPLAAPEEHDGHR